jgi:hypothetical protein
MTKDEEEKDVLVDDALNLEGLDGLARQLPLLERASLALLPWRPSWSQTKERDAK